MMSAENKPSKYALTLPKILRSRIKSRAEASGMTPTQLIHVYIRTALSLHQELDPMIEESGHLLGFILPVILYEIVQLYKQDNNPQSTIRDRAP